MERLPAFIVGLIAWIVLPGMAAARLTSPSIPFLSRGEARFAATALYAEAIWILTSGLLARAGYLRPGVVWVLALTFAVVALAVLGFTSRHSRSSHAEVSNDLWLCVVILPLLVVIASPQLARLVRRLDSLSGVFPWYYWSLTKQMLDAGGIPATSPEWGTHTAFLADYIGFNAGSAVIEMLAGSLQAMLSAQVIRAMAILATLIGVWMFARSWGASKLAATAGTAFLSTLAYFAGKLSSYRPEAFGYGLMFLVPVFASAYVVSYRRSMLMASMVGFAALSQIHGISFVYCGILIFAHMVTMLPSALRARGVELRTVVVLAVALSVSWLAADIIISRRLTQVHMAKALPARRADGTDRIWLFSQSGKIEEPPPDVWGMVRSRLTRGSVGNEDRPYFLGIGLCSVAVVLLLVKGDREARTFLICALLAVLLTVGLCIFFSVTWDTVSPLKAGFGRLFALALSLIPLAGSVAMSRLPMDRTRKLLEGGWCVVAIIAFLVTAPRIYSGYRAQLTKDTLAQLRSLELPSNSMVLANASTRGFIYAVLGVPGLLDGRAPVHDEKLLDRANALLVEARAFFENPFESPFDFDRNGVTHLLVTTKRGTLGEWGLFKVDLKSLHRLPELELLYSSKTFELFKVNRSCKF